jgi:hypothetical protein
MPGAGSSSFSSLHGSDHQGVGEVCQPRDVLLQGQLRCSQKCAQNLVASSFIAAVLSNPFRKAVVSTGKDALTETEERSCVTVSNAFPSQFFKVAVLMNGLTVFVGLRSLNCDRPLANRA